MTVSVEAVKPLTQSSVSLSLPKEGGPFVKQWDYDKIKKHRKAAEAAASPGKRAMNPDLDIVRKSMGWPAGCALDLMMDLIARYGHWAFVIYGLFLWFTPGKIGMCGGAAAFFRSWAYAWRS